MNTLKFSPQLTWLLGIALAAMAVTSCTQNADFGLFGSMAAAAKNQIMLVRKDPPSFGYKRLGVQSQVYPDLAFFVAKRGLPDFMAETGERRSQYFILYYLKDRAAFACRTRPETEGGVEFAGPYPITEREFRLLDGFRRDPSQKPKRL